MLRFHHTAARSRRGPRQGAGKGPARGWQGSCDPDEAAFHFKKADIDLPVRQVAADGYWDKIWLKQPFCAVHGGRRQTADLTLSTVDTSDSAWNDSKWKRGEVDELVLAAHVEPDEGKRMEHYGACQETIADDGGTIGFASSDDLRGSSKTMAGHEPHPGFDLVNGRVAGRAWFVQDCRTGSAAVAWTGPTGSQPEALVAWAE